MRVFAALFALLFSAAPAHAQYAEKQSALSPPRGCTITFHAGPEVKSVIDTRGFNFLYYSELCNWLRDRSLGVEVVGVPSVQQGRAIGWVTVRLLDLNTWTISPGYRATTYARIDTTTYGAQGELMRAVNAAMNDMYTDRAGQHRELLDRMNRIRNTIR
ncbi:hypothetical protein GTZ99_09565 [Novosphingobium sp. FSY-8]|uniref:Uncharacterized protein n=1 Tax=Novosphingobium ovatum TaxID=1908523 RepID=A0ABW9XE90_9SPHN|nr:hypothetical protein [Novosphingobium ovatum]NBC36803.1 hypothetical protein [Novosphingobium ovatum]